MTFQILRYHKPGEVASFVGTPGQRAANLLSHKWEEFIPENLQLPSHLKSFVEKRTYLDNSTLPDDLKTPALRCAVCGRESGGQAAPHRGGFRALVSRDLEKASSL